MIDAAQLQAALAEIWLKNRDEKPILAAFIRIVSIQAKPAIPVKTAP